MKILLLGATGRVGSHLLELLLKNEHRVTVLVRDELKLTVKHPNLCVIKGNTLSISDLEKSLRDVDGVISALNTDGKNTLSQTMKLLIPLLEANKIKRIVTVGTAGILQSRVEPTILRYVSTESKRKSTTAAADHEKAFTILKSSLLNWTIVCPTYLPDGPITKQYRTEIDFLPIDGKSISTGDTAYFTYQAFFDNKFHQTRVGLSY